MRVLEALKILEDATLNCKRGSVDTPKVREALDLLEPYCRPEWRVTGFRDHLKAHKEFGLDPNGEGQQQNLRVYFGGIHDNVRRLLEKRRCVIPVDGFYEFVGEKGSKIPWFVYLKSKEPFSLAGFWDTWKKPDGGILESFTIITMPPNDFILPIHDRIPAILHPQDEEAWLNCAGSSFDKVEPFLVPFPNDQMAAHITSTRVNNSRYNEPDCGAPIEA